MPFKEKSKDIYRGDYNEPLVPEIPVSIEKIYTVRYFELPARYTYNHPLDEHEEYEIIYLEKGVYLDKSEEKDVTMHAGDAVIYGRGYPHKSTCDGEHSASIFISSFICNSEVMREYFPDNTRTFVHFTPEQRQILSLAFEAGAKAYDINGHWCSLKSKAPHLDRQIHINYIEILLLQIIKGLKKEKNKEKIFFEHSDNRSELVSQVVEILESHVYSTVSIEDICKQVGYSRGHVCSHFKKETGKTVNSYFQYLKIEEAKRLILETNQDFTSISDTLGFGNPQYFSKVFRSLTGHTPGHFRKTIFKGSVKE